MRLCFETPDSVEGSVEIPTLVEHDRLSADTGIEKVLIDGQEVDIDQGVLADFTRVVSRMNEEVLPTGHYRDCMHFVMAMYGVWLPTCRIFAKSLETKQVYDEEVLDDLPTGPISTGIPNDSRCLGFGNDRYVYGHTALGLPTSNGIMFLQKLGIGPEFCLADLDQVLASREHEVAHPLLELSVRVDDNQVTWGATAEEI